MCNWIYRLNGVGQVHQCMTFCNATAFMHSTLLVFFVKGLNVTFTYHHDHLLYYLFLGRLVLTLFMLMDSHIHIDTISMELSILHYKGLSIKFSIKQ